MMVTSDITYMCELTLDIFDVKGLIHPNNLLILCIRKLWVH